MRVLKISFLVLILVGAFTTLGFSAQHHNVTPSPATGHHSSVSPRAVPSQRMLHNGPVSSTGKTVLPYPQGYNNYRYHYPYYNYYYPYRSFYYPYFYSSFAFYPYFSYGFAPWYYGFYSPYYSPYYGYGYGYGSYGYHPYYGYGYGYGYGEVRIEVKPKTAKVYVDGDYVGPVDDYDGWWQRLKLEPGRHRIVIREAGYAPYVQTVRVLPGDDTHIKTLMQPGQDRITEDEMRLPPGERDRDYDRHDHYRHYDRDHHPYGYDHDQDRSYENDRDDRDDDNDYNDNDHSEMNHEMNHDGEMQPDRARDYASRNEEPRDQDTRNNKMFTVQVEPHDATIYIDGNYYGTADVNESGQVQALLPEGKHKVEVVRPGYESFSQDINVGSSDNKLVVQLHKK